jgi:putative ABC transport system ATP-binding protein
MIKVTDLTKTYAGRKPVEVLMGITLAVECGEFVAIMGRSGSGKSTLLHQLGLIDVPTSGSIIIDHTDVACLSESQKAKFRLQRLGYVFQEFALVEELTAFENVCLPAMALQGKANDYKNRAADLLELVGLENRLHHYPAELSGGEQQRAAVARALINKPNVLFADEPTAHLDSASSKTVLDLFAKLNKEFNQTIVMVTHEDDDKKYISRIVYLKDGRIVDAN